MSLPAEPAETAAPTDSAAPVDRVDRVIPVHPADRADPVDPADSAVLRDLAAALPAGRVDTSEPALGTHATDASGEGAGGRPLAVLHPESTAEVSAALAVAHRHRVPVVPQGARTGLAGGATAGAGALVLCLERMDAIVRIDPVDRVAVVQPGVLTARLAAAAAERGLFYAPDPASAETSTIGGNIATNAGGMRCVKYGVTRDAVRALQLVLADGRVVRAGAVTAKGVAGLDLVGLVVGSEGTLAVVAEATLALLPAPGPVRGVLAAFPDVPHALDAVREILAGARTPCTLELLDSVVAGAIAAFDPGAGLPHGTGALVLALTDAASDGAADVAAYADAARRSGAIDVQAEDEPGRVDALLRARRAFQPALRALHGASLNGDVCVPLSQLAELVDRLGALSADAGLPVGVGGHVGDGNLHPVVCYDPADPDAVRRARRVYDQFGRIAVALGGTATGEHGAGVERLAVVADELGPDVVGLQRAVKAAFDPRGVLNPGKKY